MTTRVSKEFKKRVADLMREVVGHQIKIERPKANRIRVTVCDANGKAIVEWADEEVKQGNSLSLWITPQAFTIHLD